MNCLFDSLIPIKANTGRLALYLNMNCGNLRGRFSGRDHSNLVMD